MSHANGPGARAVVWVQGCSLDCPGCFNPETHDPAGGELVDVATLAEKILGIPGIEGVTFSGGEPLDQAEALGELVGRLRAMSELSVVVFTGYTRQAVERRDDLRDLLGGVDVLIAGPYDGHDPGARPWQPPNKEFVFLTDRYCVRDFDQIPTAEVIIGPDGTVTVTGVDPPNLAIDAAEPTGGPPR